MNRIAGRAGIVILLVLLLLGGFTFFLVEYFVNAGDWVVFSGSPHVYNGANIGCGVVKDSEGLILLDTEGKWAYTPDEVLRKATVHWVGDRYGSIDAPALSNHASDMVGYDFFSGVFSGEAGQRTSCFRIGTGLIFTVKCVDVLDELAVEQVQGDALRTYTTAFTTVGAAACHVESTDDVEHLLFKGIHIGFLSTVELGAVKDALAAAAGGTNVPARVAADTLGKLSLEESKFLLGAHCLDAADLVKAVNSGGFFAFTDQLVVNCMLLAFAAEAAAQHAGSVRKLSVTVQRFHLNGIRVGNGQNALNTGLLDLLDAQLALAAYTDDVGLFPVYTVFGYQLVEAVAVAGLQADQCLALKLAGFDHVLGQVGSTEVVVNKILHSFYAVEESGFGVVGVFTDAPAKNPVNGAVFQQFDGTIL